MQAHDATLDALAGLTTAANKLPYFTNADVAAVTDLSAFGRSLIDDADAATARATLGLASVPREVLTANRTYYVRTDGSDSNNGLANSSGGAFLTIQKAIDVVAATLDLGIYSVTISVANGTYTGQIALKSLTTAGGIVTITGNISTPANVVITSASHTVVLPGPISGTYKFEGVRGASSGGNFMALYNKCYVQLGVFELGACAIRGIEAMFDAHVQLLNNFSVVGDIPYWVFRTALFGVIDISTLTLTHSGTRTHTSGFAVAESGGLINAWGMTISGSFTGKNYDVNTGGGMTLAGGGTSYFGGSVAGTVTSPGWKT